MAADSKTTGWRCPMHDPAWLARQIAGLLPRTDRFSREQAGADIAAALITYDEMAHGLRGDAPHTDTKEPAQDRREKAAIALWHRFAPAHRMEWDDEPPKDEYRAAVDAVMEALYA